MNSRRYWKVNSILICLLVLYLFLALFSIFVGGVTWDEILDFEGVNGAFWHGLDVLKGRSPDFSSITFDLEYFGNATRWPTYLAWRLLSTTPWESFSGIDRVSLILGGSYVGLNHFSSILYGLSGIVVTFLIGYHLGGRRLSILSITILISLPTWIGHSWMNSKDIPFATSYLIYTYGSVLLLTRSPHKACPRLSFWLRLIGISLLLGSRIGSISFVVISELFYLFILGRKYCQPFLSVILGAFVGFLLTPQAWRHPISYPLEAIEFISNRQGSSTPLATALYIVNHLYESLPLVLVLGILGLIVLSCVKKKLSLQSLWTPVILQLFIAPTLLVLGSKTLYNELRHILFIYPCLCLFSAKGWLLFCESEAVSRGFRRLALVIFSFLLTLLLAENISLAPYQYVYRSDISRLISPGDLVHRDYWGFSNTETIRHCLKDGNCFNLLQLHPLTLRDGDWNRDIFVGFRNLVQPSDVLNNKEVLGGKLQLQVSPFPDMCRGDIVATQRKVLFPYPQNQLLSRIADCP